MWETFLHLPPWTCGTKVTTAFVFNGPLHYQFPKIPPLISYENGERHVVLNVPPKIVYEKGELVEGESSPNGAVKYLPKASEQDFSNLPAQGDVFDSPFLPVVKIPNKPLNLSAVGGACLDDEVCDENGALPTEE